MKAIISLTILAVVASVSASATIINIPDDYPAIQQGIDASTDGDTVLVQPGTYVENVNFNGHNIVLGSLYLTTGDTSYIEQTVIDGGAQGRVLTLTSGEDSTTVITGLKIQNGLSTAGAGILCSPASPRIIRNIVCHNYGSDVGGGIAAGSPVTISGNIVYDNHSGADGGGISVMAQNVLIESNIIFDNVNGGDYTRLGGGLFVRNSGIVRNNIICNNQGTNGGGLACVGDSLYIVNNVIIHNQTYDNRPAVVGVCSSNHSLIIENCIIWNNSASELYIHGAGYIDVGYNVIRNGYPGTGNLSSNPLLLDPLNNNYNVCSQSPCIDAGDPNMYDPDGTRSDIGLFFPDHPDCFTGTVWNVSMSGNDTTGTGSPENPFRTVQHAVDVCPQGDSILVHNGTYVENVEILFKDIVIMSNYIYSGQFEDIQSTVLDGDSLSAVATFVFSDSAMVMAGFTITNGGASGLSCVYGDPVIRNNIIRNNYCSSWGGGGISCTFADPLINSNIIAGNKATTWGGGIYSYESNPVITSNTITGNSPCGIDISHEFSCLISNCIIWANVPQEVVVRGNHIVDITYSDIRGGYVGEGNIDVNPLLVDPEDSNYNLCLQSPCIDAGNPAMFDPDGSRIDMGFFFADHPQCEFGGDRWYVSTAGNDTSGDGSQDNPFRTIQHAVDVSFHNDTVIVENGTYDENVVIHDKSLALGSEFLFTGDWNDVFTTVITGESASCTVTLEGCDSASSVTGFTISNGYGEYGGGILCSASHSSISHNIITENAATYGGGICSFYSNSVIDGNTITNNTANTSGSGLYSFESPLQISNNLFYNNSGAVSGGGLSLSHSDALITNNMILGNSVSVYGGGLWCSESDAEIFNNTMSGNTAGYYGGGLGSRYSTPYVLNTIFWGDSALLYPNTNEIYVHVGNSPVINYSDIEGGWEGQGNIDVDPLFRDPESGDFHLMSTACGDPYDSPCIDAGHPDILDSLLDCSWGLGELRSDMGAYGGGDSVTVGIDQDEMPVPKVFSLFQNYPNPFNASTIIRYTLPEPSRVTIEIYDILGRRVETCLDDYREAGKHQVIWDAGDLPSGIYFYSIQAGDYRRTNKMILLR
jgi:hypothetical protein